MRRSPIAAPAAVLASLVLTGCGTSTTVTKYPVSGSMIALPSCPGDNVILGNEGLGDAIRRANPDLAALPIPVAVTGPQKVAVDAQGRMTLTLTMCGAGVGPDGTKDAASLVARSFARTDTLGTKVVALHFENIDTKIRIVAAPVDTTLFASDKPVTDLRSQWRDDIEGK